MLSVLSGPDQVGKLFSNRGRSLCWGLVVVMDAKCSVVAMNSLPYPPISRPSTSHGGCVRNGRGSLLRS